MTSSSSAFPHPHLLGIGNPLLDISANVDANYLSKHQIQAGLAKLAEERDLPIYSDLVTNHRVDYTAGGATQNSIRVCQWMIGRPNATAFVGAVGKDDFASQLSQSATNDGVHVEYHQVEGHPTGTCAVLIADKERSLIANLGAANHFHSDHLKKSHVHHLIEGAKVFYSAGFFLTVSPPSLIHIAKHAHSTNKLMCGNLSADFICMHFYGPLMEAMPYYDILFGNDVEAVAFGKKRGMKEEGITASAVAKEVSLLPKENNSRPRIVIFTQGRNPTVVAIKGEVREFPFDPIDSKLIVDLNGAGDAFVGGFLSVLLDDVTKLEGPIDESTLKRAIDAGHWAASQIIQVSGIVLKGQPKKF